MTKYKIIPFLLLLLLAACSSDNDDNGGSNITRNNTNANFDNVNPVVHRLEFPRLKGGQSLVVTHFDGSEVNYTVEWDSVKRATRWSCYELYASNRVTRVSRYYPGEGQDQYPTDPDLHCSTAWTTRNDPYWRSGYDHGHLCPSADRRNTSRAQYQTFYLTNMSPQVNGFNAGVWANMETWVRNQLNINSTDTLYVVKGGTIDNANQYTTMQRSGGTLIIPRYFFMALLMKNSSGYKAMGFWIEHKSSSDSGKALAKYVVNIDELERLTGLDFFCNLPDDEENHVEGLNVDNVKRAWGF